MPKIGIVIPADNKYEEVWQVTYPNLTDYANKHGYEIVRIHESGEREMPWHKIAMAEYLLGNWDWLFLRGVDFLVMNPEIKLESFIDDVYDMIVSEDCHGINFDAVLIKNCDWSRKYLNFIYKEGYKRYDNDCWKEQRCVIETHKDAEWKGHIKVIPQKSFNSYHYPWYDPNGTYPGQYTEGDLHLHFVGLLNEDRVTRMSEYLKK